jgi:hypothetical protein
MTITSDHEKCGKFSRNGGQLALEWEVQVITIFSDRRISEYPFRIIANTLSIYSTRTSLVVIIYNMTFKMIMDSDPRVGSGKYEPLSFPAFVRIQGSCCKISDFLSLSMQDNAQH